MTNAELEKQTSQIISKLKKLYPNAHCALHHQNAFQLLVATILSAQCTDERVNKVTPVLFKALPGPKDFIRAPIETIEELIRSTGFYKNKAKNIKGMAEQLVKKYEGNVPNNMESLIDLPGVGRKTANVILGNVFEIPGLVVDTHVTRLSNRMGIAKGEDAVKIEQQLMKLVPENEWTQFSHLMIFHGRQVCKARKPDCYNCLLNKICPKIGVSD